MKIDRETQALGLHAGGMGQVTCSEARRRNWQCTVGDGDEADRASIKAIASLG